MPHCRIRFMLAATLVAVCACATATQTTDANPPHDALTVPVPVKAANQSYWKKLGITPPEGGFVLTHPWSKPWSGRSLVVPMAWFMRARKTVLEHYKSGKPLMVDAASMRADLPMLHTALEKNYSGWEIAAKKGWDWNAWFKHWDAMLAGYGHTSISASKAFAPWEDYEHFQIDSHSGPTIPGMIGHDVHSLSALLAAIPGNTCTSLQTSDGKTHKLDADDAAQQPHAVRNWTGKALQPASYIVYPSSYGTAKSVTCGDQTITVTPFWNPHGKPTRPVGAPPALKHSVMALSGGKKGLAIYNTLTADIGYLRLGAFVSAGDEAFARLLKKLPASAGHEKLLIVDLRHNSGGNAPFKSMSRWIPVDRISKQLTQVSKRSCLYPGLWFNLGQMLAMQVKPPVTESFRQDIKSYDQGLDAAASGHCPVSFKTTTGKWHYLDHHFVHYWQGSYPRLLVLVDNECGSDCERMAWGLAQLPGAIIAGENTYGLTGFTQPGVLLLPHTRILFDLATSRTNGYGDGRSTNGYGLDVDVVLPNEADWSKPSILALANELLGSTD